MISPYLHFHRQETDAIGSAANRLFKQFSLIVAGLFVIGTIAPASAFYGDSNMTGSQTDEGIDTGGYEYSILADSDGYLTKINPQTDVGDRSTMNDHLIHTVSDGETVSTIAASYGLKSSTILWENGLDNANSIRVGQKLMIPPVDGITHTVAKGEDVTKIAGAYGVNPGAIMKQNRLTAMVLTPGQELFIPGGKPIANNDVAAGSSVRTTPSRTGTTTRLAAAGVITSSSAGGAIMSSSQDKPVGNKPFIFPTRGVITQTFHAGHYAFDIADRSQPPVWAAGGGKVVLVTTGCAWVSYGCGGGYGNHVIIDHGNGLQTLYGHLQAVYVQVGDQVSQGQVIGKMGRSGNVRGATGIHLHFEVRLNGKKEVPSNYY